MFPTLLAAVALSAPVPKAAPIDLNWKFTKGDVFYVTHRERVATTAELGNGLKIDAVITTELAYQLKVTATDAKRTELRLTFLSGKKGANDNRGVIVTEDIPDLADRTVVVHLDATHAITSVEDADDPNGELKAFGFVQERSVRARLTELLAAAPGKVEAGTWAAEREDEPTEGLRVKRSDRGKVADTTDGLTTLAVSFDVEVNDGLPGSSAYRLSGTGQSRKVGFDTRMSRVRKVTETCELSGTVEDCGVGGKETIPVTQKRTTTITVSDDKPKARK
jgi:hypothetical protein